MKKKTISLFLSLVICLTLLPTAALAETPALICSPDIANMMIRVNTIKNRK